MEKEYQQLDAVNNRVELEKDNWKLRFKCCDCGLVHIMAFAIEENGNLGIAIDRESHKNKCEECNDTGYSTEPDEESCPKCQNLQPITKQFNHKEKS